MQYKYKAKNKIKTNGQNKLTIGEKVGVCMDVCKHSHEQINSSDL